MSDKFAMQVMTVLLGPAIVINVVIYVTIFLG